ncbi:MAG: CoB--CoM heterodisulfide reductase iron-sulfur subunit A family protein [Deltaproteobacteria bacterium]|jgi:heterodisulfide reductase subunit A|nr:MAG: CoB--CoM heterodisulfide reductase iron-sulfur subunit A family protein [Deltaproteobacteria bacterium]
MNKEDIENYSAANKKIGAVMVVGGGIAGIQASLDLANSGYYVYLVEKSPSIGGVMPQLDKTFPTNDCSMCILSPKLVECGRHFNIEILTNTQVEEVLGEAGNLEVSLIRSPRFVDEDKCVGCGVCAEKCPVKVKDKFNEGLGERKAIYIQYPQAIPLVYQIDKDHCRYFIKGKCRICEKLCKNEAVNFEDTEKRFTLKVGSIILAPGFELFDPQLKGEYGYGVYDNVVTSKQFERILSASGPSMGHLERPGDKKEPKKIGFIQCVGSRDLQAGKGYCSSVCCMYAIKEAVVAKEHSGEVEPTIFFMDIRAHGKGFDDYYKRAEEEYGVRFIRCMVSKIVEMPRTKNLRVTYINEEGKPVEEEFDMMVLSGGLTPSEDARALGERLEIRLNQYGFCETSQFSPLSTSRAGIFVSGVFQGPKDIPETVAQASGSVACASGLLSESRGSMVKGKEYPLETEVKDISPRIGVFVCHCGINIGGVIDVPQVKGYAESLRDVVYAEEGLYVCSQDFQELMKKAISEHNLNRVVVASCSPRTHEPLFQETLRETGLNKYLFEMANIRDQCSWVHMRQKEDATKKAKALVRMAVENARLIQPLDELSLEIKDKALVIGGGLSGMTAALSLADQGYEVYLVEKEAKLGGVLHDVYYTLEGDDVQSHLREIIERVEANPSIHIFKDTMVVDFSGYKGNFEIGLMVGPGMFYRKLEHGIVIVATGGEEYKPVGEYMYGEDELVMTQLELEKRIANGAPELSHIDSIVMIQCVGSRTEERPYCSRVCCSEAVKNSLKLKELNPNMNICILYRDIRSYGLMEDYYTLARKKGVKFIRYDLNSKPGVTVEDGALKVNIKDPALGEDLSLSPDLIVLSSAIIPKENDELATLLKVPRTQEGFFLEAHMKLRPVDFATDGIYVCGLAHSPKLISECISQAYAASARASTILSQERIHVGGVVATVNGDLCAACLTCVRVCPYDVPVINEEGFAEINMAKCQGCGSCASECPAKAIELQHFRDEQILAKCNALLEEAV